MPEGFSKEWPAKIEAERQRVDAMVAQLASEDVKIERYMENNVGALSYHLTFSFPKEEAETNVFISLLDYQTDSDLIITNMTTLPDSAKSRGLGSEAIRKITEWAKANNLKTIRAVQVAFPESQKFWKKNGFAAVKNSRSGDFLFTAPDKP